jgi:hypothetical protein
VAKNPKIENQISFDFSFASINFLYSKVCEFRILINADPSILSFIILLSQSIVSCAALNSLLTFENIIKKAIQIIGTIVKTARASCQFIIIKRILAQIIKKTEDIIDDIAPETNVFTESTSEVIFVRSFEGLTVCI